jgi:DNA-nicking Smr family endonuclease
MRKRPQPSSARAKKPASTASRQEDAKKPHSAATSASSEDALFRELVGDVAPLKVSDRVLLTKVPPKPRPRPRDHNDLQVDELSDYAVPEREPGQPLSFTRPGVQRQKVRQLRRGGHAIEDELDLHGLTVSAARPLLVRFLNACGRRGLRCVRVIHGKGMRSQSGEGVLKGMVASWLAQRSDVLAYHEARPADGGSGAVIVLLRREV